MMESIRNIDYQKEAIFGCEDEGQEGLIDITNRLLKAKIKKDYPEVILKAITGAGKTIIMSQYIKEMYKQEDRPCIIFVWLSIGTGGLQFQSAEKIKSLLSPFGIKIICPETEKDFNETSFTDKTVVVLNWEKINNTKNDNLVSKLMIGERHNLKKAIENTSKDTKFIVLIDEFHKNYRTDAYNILMKTFNAKMILGMTATPTKDQMTNKSAWYSIPISKVRESGMIKLGTIFNENCKDIDLTNDMKYGLEEGILKVAINKRMELEKKLRAEGSKIVPLCLIQIPNSNKEILENIKKFLSEQKENGRYLVEDKDYICWLSEIPKNRDIIENMSNNNIKYLIFKQAVATGWDCPRAYILVKYRPLKKELEAFDLQTIGRVLRTPERKFYKDEDLNYAYIYAPENRFENRFAFEKEVEDGLGNAKTSNQIIRYTDDVSLVESFLVSENYIETSLTFAKIKSVFIELLEDRYNNGKQNKELEKIHIFDGKLDINDKLLEDDFNGIKTSDNVIEYNYVQLGRNFNKLLKKIGKPYLTQDSIRAILFDFFDKYIDKKITDENRLIEKIKLCLMYKDTIIKAIQGTSIKIHQQTERKRGEDTKFIFPKNSKYLVENKIDKYKKCLYSPCVDNGFSEPEHIFIQELELNENVKWWYKNLNKGSQALSIIYIYEEGNIKGKYYSIIAPTYPDFIVFFENNKKERFLGIYEIKDVDKVENVNDRKHSAIKDFVILMERKKLRMM